MQGGSGLAFSLPFLQTGGKALIGVDISAYAVKMVELASAGRIERYAIELLDRGVVSDGNIANMDAATAAVKRCWSKLGGGTKRVAVALPSSAVIMKKIALPGGLSSSELDAQVQSEANQYIPFAIEEVNLDYQVIGPSAANPEDQDVLIAASRKEKIEDRVACVEGAGLKAEVVDVESNAIQNAFELTGGGASSEPVALVGIGMTVLNLSVLRGGDVLFTREQAFGGAQLTDEIVRAYGMSAIEAERGKIAQTLPANYESEILAPFLESMALEVSRALQFFYTSSSYHQVSEIVLHGGCAILPGAADLVAEKTDGSRVSIANPFAGMALSSKLRAKQLATDAPMLMTACGLALRRFDP